MATVNRISPVTYELQSYNPNDAALLNQFSIDTALTSSSCIEFFIYDLNQNIVSNPVYNYTGYTVENDGQSAGNDNQITNFTLSPGDDVEAAGFNQGKYIAYYNYLTKQIGNSNQSLYISEISSDRTEIRLDTNYDLTQQIGLDENSLVEQTNKFINFRDNQDYFVDFYINLGLNNLYIANNIKLDNPNSENPTILIKLYEPLPPEIEIKQGGVWIVTTLNESEAFQVDIPIEQVPFDDFERISGPNFNIPIKSQINNSTIKLSESDIIQNVPSSSANQLDSILFSQSIDISVDYTDYTDFIHFSSAQTRIENFYYKVGLIENYSASISDLNSVSGSSTSTNLLENNITNVIKNFDKFEYFLYYTSASLNISGSDVSYPKTTSSPPYQLAKTGSVAALKWLGTSDIYNTSDPYYGGSLYTASIFDNQNPDQLKKSIPEYLREDPANQPYDLFVDMVAQYYDNVWLYTKDVTQKYNADNRLDFGISKDLVADAIKDFGLKLYQNNFSNEDLYTAFLGITPSGSIFPVANITSSLPAPTGFEFVNTLISASNDIIPLNDANKSLYKRLYHNIPYLLKSKGTMAGLRALITSYGIPDTILKISEFGGKDKVDENDWDLYFNKFNYAFSTSGSDYLKTQWQLNDSWGFTSPQNNPRTLEFRFKPEILSGSSSSSGSFGLTNVSQSLFNIVTGDNSVNATITLEYTGSGLNTGSLVNDSGSYKGSIKDPYYQYAYLNFYPSASDTTTSASLYLPFFDGGWWSVMVTSGSTGHELYAANKIYNGKDGTEIGYIASSSVTSSFDGWSTGSGKNVYFASSSLYPGFSGSLQEIRYYTTKLSESVFKDYVMNPLSIEGNGVNSSPDQLAFRAALGSELDITTTSSIHPKITGSWDITQSFSGSNSGVSADSFFQGLNTSSYYYNNEYVFLDQFPAGIKNRVTDKVRFENNVVPTGSTLSPIRRVAQTTEASASYTDNLNYLEVAFSPQNQINDDIISQLGNFNLGDYIADPRQRSSSLLDYPDLDNLSKDYFKKYSKPYNLTDFIRLIKFFDNSLFKMIKDFIPVRTSLASGLVIKQHLLERNKYPQPQVNINTPVAKVASFEEASSEIEMTTQTQFPMVTQVGSFLILNSGNTPGSPEPVMGQNYILQNLLLTGSVLPQWNGYDSGSLVNATAGPGGMFNEFNNLSTSPAGASGSGPVNSFNITQSWSVTTPSLSGSVTSTHDSQTEFYDGELSGSTMLITNGELNESCFWAKNVNPEGAEYGIRSYNSTSDTFSLFIDTKNQPLDGFIQTWFQDDTAVPLPPPPFSS